VSSNIPTERVISAPDIESIYDVPVNFDKDKIGETVLEVLHLSNKKNDDTFKKWMKFAKGVKNNHEHIVNIAIVGKYFNTGDFILTDSYISVLEAIKFSAYAENVKAHIHTVNSRDFEIKNPDYKALDKFDGIIVPGGFGESGIEGKLNVIRYARENKIPYFGLCYGMQLMTIEYARNVLGLKGAQTAEIDKSAPHLIIDIMPDQKKKIAEGNYGGSMRLGLYTANIKKDTVAHDAYKSFLKVFAKKNKTNDVSKVSEKSGEINILERHRHRYEVNPEYIGQLENGGLIFSGKSPDNTLMEIAELPRSKHPFFLGTQFHPELLARPLAPHPLFTEFVKAAKNRKG
jgi:CTP synthase